MTDETMSFWNFIFNAGTAIGTVGAVVISLVATLWPKKRFKVHNVEARAMHSIVGNTVERTSSTLLLDVENCTEFQMQIFDARIHISDQESQVLPFQNTLIPAMSRYSASTALPQGAVRNGAFKNPKKIKVTLGTSFGNSTVKVTNPDTLRRIMESEDEYTTVDTGSR